MTTIRAMSWNVNGLRAVHKKGFLDWVAQESPDVLCLQETKANEDQLPTAVANIEGYTSYFCSAERKGYSGVALYTKATPERVEHGLGVDAFDSEGRVILADYGRFVLVNIYFPNGKSSPERLDFKMKFYDTFLDFVDRLRHQGKSVVFCGDVNTAHKPIDLARPKENEKVSGFLSDERAWMDKLLDHGYLDTFRMFNQEPGHYSYWDQMSRARDRNIGWRIDYFFVDRDFAPSIRGGFILPEIMGSDHCPIGITIDLDI